MSDLGVSTISVNVAFSGGLELMFSNQALHTVQLPNVVPSTAKPTDLRYLLKYLCDELMTDSRRGLFVVDNSVRPGILVLINNTDWELEGEEDYVLQDKDEVLFVSTLHGG